PVPADEASARPALLARLPDGRRLNFRCSGQGSPTVILEGGYGATSLAWGRVRAVIEKTNRVCTYDRAGLGFSDPGPLPRDGAAAVGGGAGAARRARAGGAGRRGAAGARRAPPAPPPRAGARPAPGRRGRGPARRPGGPPPLGAAAAAPR